MDQILQFVPNNGGVKGDGGVEMDQILQFVPNRGRNGSNSPIRAEQWRVKGVRGVEMDQGPKWIKFSNSC